MPGDRRNLPGFLRSVEPEEWVCEDSEAIKRRCFNRLTEVVGWVDGCAKEPKTVLWFEPRLVSAVFSLGLLLMQLFLARADEAQTRDVGWHVLRKGARYVKRARQGRLLGTFFGK